MFFQNQRLILVLIFILLNYHLIDHYHYIPNSKLVHFYLYLMNDKYHHRFDRMFFQHLRLILVLIYILLNYHLIDHIHYVPSPILVHFYLYLMNDKYHQRFDRMFFQNQRLILVLILILLNYHLIDLYYYIPKSKLDLCNLFLLNDYIHQQFDRMFFQNQRLILVLIQILLNYHLIDLYYYIPKSKLDRFYLYLMSVIHHLISDRMFFST